MLLQYSSQIVETKPFPNEFSLEFSYIHSSHVCSHSKVPSPFPMLRWATRNLEHWDDCSTQINIGEGETHTSVSRFVTSIVATDDLLIISSQTEIDIRGEGWRWLAFSTTSSFLSQLFILSLFTVIQASISRTQSFTPNFASSAEDDSEVRGVSSAYKWKATWLVSHNITQEWSIKQE